MQRGVIALGGYHCTLPHSKSRMPALPDVEERPRAFYESLSALDAQVTEEQRLVWLAAKDHVDSRLEGRPPRWLKARTRGRRPRHLASRHSLSNREEEVDRQFKGELKRLRREHLQLGRLRCLTQDHDLRKLNLWYKRLHRDWSREANLINRYVNNKDLRNVILFGVQEMISSFRRAVRSQVRVEVAKEVASEVECAGHWLEPAVRRCRVELNCLGLMVFQLVPLGSGLAAASLKRAWPKMQALDEELEAVVRLTRTIRGRLLLGARTDQAALTRLKALTSEDFMTSFRWCEFKSLLSRVVDSSDDE